MVFCGVDIANDWSVRGFTSEAVDLDCDKAIRWVLQELAGFDIAEEPNRDERNVLSAGDCFISCDC